MRKNIVVAHDLNRVIGYEEGLPWRGQVPEDMKRFRKLTLGHTVVMGRKTFESIGHPLAERKNIVLSRESNLQLEGVEVVSSLDDAYELAVDDTELFIIGGSSVYELALDAMDRLYITRIEHEFEGDTFFVEIDSTKWLLMSYEHYAADDKNDFSMEFMTYERK